MNKQPPQVYMYGDPLIHHIVLHRRTAEVHFESGYKRVVKADKGDFTQADLHSIVDRAKFLEAA